MSVKFRVHIRRAFDDEIIIKDFEYLSWREVQAMRMEEQLLPGELLEFESTEMPRLGLQRRTELKRTEMKRSTTPIASRSDKRVKEDRVRSKAVAKLKAELGEICELGPIIGTPCFGPIHGHEVLPRGRGGSITDPENIMLACDGHNGWASEHTDEAEALGILKKSGEQS